MLFTGVGPSRTPGLYCAEYRGTGGYKLLGDSFRSQEAAASAYDAWARRQGDTAVNFPLIDGEVQAVPLEPPSCVMPQDDATAAHAPDDAGLLYKGVSRSRSPGLFQAEHEAGGVVVSLGSAFRKQEEAAQAYDKEMRRRGSIHVNFPRIPGEVKTGRPASRTAALPMAPVAVSPQCGRTASADEPAHQPHAAAQELDDADLAALVRDFQEMHREELASLCILHGGVVAARELLLSQKPSTPVPQPVLTGEFAAMYTSISGKPA